MAWDIELKSGTTVEQSRPLNHNDFHAKWWWDFMTLSNFLKNVSGSSNFRKIWAIVLKLHTDIIHRSRIFGIDFGLNQLERSNFFKSRIFWKCSLSCVTCANFKLLSSKFVYECTSTKWCFIRKLERIGWVL